MYVNTSENELKRQNRTFFVKISLQIGKKRSVLALHKSKNRAKSVSPPDPVQYGIVLLRARVSYLRDSSTEIAYVSPT